MIYFIYGQDSYRAKKKLEEIVLGYKKVHKSGLNLIYVDASEDDFKDFYNNLIITSMFAEKKLIVLKNTFSNSKFQEDFLENKNNLEETKDIIIVYEDGLPDKRTKFFKALQKCAKCQELEYLQPAMLKKWILQELEKGSLKTKINPDALEILANFAKNDLWRVANEINKLSNYRMGGCIKREDVELLVRPDIENDIFKTIDALASKDKKKALFLLHKHLEDGENHLYLLSMISYQFRNLLMVKELQEAGVPYQLISKKSGLHPFVAQKIYYMCNQFSMPQLKKIYHEIFKVDSDIKTGKVEPETSLDLLLSKI